ncbi:MAG: zf-HC2 domain-containing protein [Planctomycetes bacterium]|nr:zf-HC2 domain-containing protein [Planctomycetota bacterium]
MSHCRLARDLPAYVDRDLPLDASLVFEAHLAGCDSCAAAVAAQRALDDALAELPRPRPAGPERVRLLAAIAERVDSPPQQVRRSPPIRWLRRIAVAAATLALLVAGATRWLPRRPSPEPGPLTAAEIAAEIATESLPVAGIDSPSEEPPSEQAPPSAFAAADSEPARLAAPRGELAGILRRLGSGHAAAEGGDLLTTFLVAAQPLSERGVSLTALLMALLHDEDGELATASAEVLGAAIHNGAMRRDEPGLIGSLERALRRSDRGAAMLRALAAIGTRGAFEAIARTAAQPALREPALIALAASGRCDLQDELERALVDDLRGRADDVARAERVAAHLVLPHPEALRTLGALARAGLRESCSRAVLTRATTTAVPLLAAALRGGEGALRGESALRDDAIALAPLCGDAALASPLAVAARHPGPAITAIRALRAIGGSASLLALAEWRAEASPSRTLAHAAEDAFSAIADGLDRAALNRAITATALADAPIAAAFAEFALVADGAGAAPLRAALLDHPLTPSCLRARTALALARGHEPFPAARALELLRGAAPDSTDTDNSAGDATGGSDDSTGASGDGGDGGLVAALLVLLYAEGHDPALRDGLAALDWRATPPRVARFAAAAQRVLTEQSIDRSVDRLGSLLALGP